MLHLQPVPAPARIAICCLWYAVVAGAAWLICAWIIRFRVPLEVFPEELSQLRRIWKRYNIIPPLISIAIAILYYRIPPTISFWSALIWPLIPNISVVSDVSQEASRVRYCADNWRREDNRKAVEFAAQANVDRLAAQLSREEDRAARIEDAKARFRDAVARLEQELHSRWVDFRLSFDLDGTRPAAVVDAAFRAALVAEGAPNLGLLKYSRDTQLRALYGDGAGFPYVPPPSCYDANSSVTSDD